MERNSFPVHIAIIPDGNRRWAKKKGLPAAAGHLEGANNFKKIARVALDVGVKYLTIWGGSYDNLTKRGAFEIKALLELYDKYLKSLLKSRDITENKVRVRVVGRFKEVLFKKTLKTIEELENKTKEYADNFLTFLIAYNGTDEMLEAVSNIAGKAKKDAELKATPELLKANLWTGELPLVDLIIRTGEEGDPHNSAGFMMWHTAYSQYYFTETLWPSFSPEEFKQAVESFAGRERRLGK